LYEYNPIFDTVEEKVPPKLNRKALTKYIIDNLFEQQKTFASAGSASSQRFTPFRNTVTNLENYVKAHPGVTYSKAMESISFHYKTVSTAKIAILKWIQNGVISTIRIERDGKTMCLYYSGEDEGI
jgi:hypothetical protein